MIQTDVWWLLCRIQVKRSISSLLYDPSNCFYENLHNYTDHSKVIPTMCFRMVLYFKIRLNNLNLGHVSSEMSCESALLSVGFVAFVAPERLFPSVRLHVALQIT